MMKYEACSFCYHWNARCLNPQGECPDKESAEQLQKEENGALLIAIKLECDID